MQIVDRVKELIGPIINERKYFVLEVTFKREGGQNVLRVLVDKEGGIAMDECACLNSELNELLDNENIIDDEYIIEVSSPGLDRKLKADEDFVWAVGRRIRVSTYEPIDGKNVFEGKLMGLGSGTIVIEQESVSSEIPREKIASAKLAPDIDWSE